jgi:hypothetical protein
MARMAFDTGTVKLLLEIWVVVLAMLLQAVPSLYQTAFPSFLACKALIEPAKVS